MMYSLFPQFLVAIVLANKGLFNNIACDRRIFIEMLPVHIGCEKILVHGPLRVQKYLWAQRNSSQFFLHKNV